MNANCKKKINIGNIYSRPAIGKMHLFTEIFFAEDRVPVGTRSEAKKKKKKTAAVLMTITQNACG